MPDHNTEVLIVEESSTIRATIAEYLGDEYIIYYATDGEEGWKLLQSNESIALVFSDMNISVEDDMMLLQKIRESSCERIANIPVIMITGDDEDEAKIAALNIGATDFINKPFDKIDVLSRTRSYTRFNRQIADLEKQAAYDTLTGLYSNQMLLEFGHKTISFANRHNTDASVLYVEIADIQKLTETYGNRTTETIVSTVAGLLENSIRKEELVAHLEGGRFVIVLPQTKTFMAQIAASRLKEAVEELVFNVNNIKIQVSLAVGLCSTQVDDKSEKIAFEEYCVHASHALTTSLNTPNRRIIRYDESYEKMISEDQFTDSHPASNAQDLKDLNAEYLSCILGGDYSSIPPEQLSYFIDPLEDFLEFALASVQENKKASG